VSVRPRGCGSCNLCCKLLHVPDIGKPAGMTCWWTTVHGGCVRQAEKPNPAAADFDEETGVHTLHASEVGKDLSLLACATFECLWLESQRLEDSKRLLRIMRPDMTHVVMGPADPNDPGLLYIQVDPEHPTAWRAPRVAAYLNAMLAKGARLEVICGESRFPLSEPF
jgi:hypothetical protein